MRSLVIYYSFEGNTKHIAKAIADEISADLLELKVKNEIGTKGFMKYLWGGKQVFQKSKPELMPLEKNPNDYQLIFIGTPVWAFSFTPAIRTFLETTNLKDKKIALFCTHQGMPGKTLQEMKEKLANNDILSENDFAEVLKNPQKNALIAKAWAGNIISLLKKSKVD